ncbi:MAG: ATP-binding cassette domain-containing protein [Proteobacteria bacterium]|nr:MAG: ATP-binding cassette domain-containing protein [Pseudomonadota bacterium]
MLEARGIRYSYRLGPERQTIVHDVSISVGDGEMVAIQGPSGSGKSTLLYLLGGLLKPDAGTVEIDGTEITRLPEDSLARFRNQNLGFVFQQFHLLPRASVLENILLPARYPAESAEPGPQDFARAKELAELVGLGHRLEHFPNQLSGGQQQRVAIARALMKNPRLILADEPTGNLDSKSAEQILGLLKDLNAKGHSIVIITHDSQVAARCERTVHIHDGRVLIPEGGEAAELAPKPPPAARAAASPSPIPRAAWGALLGLSWRQLPLAWDNLRRNRLRSFLTMLGIIIGIAAVLSMITLGNYAKEKILDSYATLGVNTMRFYGYRNWDLKATDIVPGVFTAFNLEKDINPLPKLFPAIRRLTPVFTTYEAKVSFGGRATEPNDGQLVGMNSQGLNITGRELLVGRGFSPYQVELGSSVCIIGYAVAEKLLQNTNPLGQVINVTFNKNRFACRVIGVLKSVSSNSSGRERTNGQVIIPSTLFPRVVKERWYARLDEVLIQTKPGTDLEKTGTGIQRFFEMKFGRSGRFRADADSVLVAQMNRFLTIFTLLLAAIALLSLAVGGIGIANMMLVSVNERFREIGLRKALGASPASIRAQLLTESILLCVVGGLLGIGLGFIGYQAILYAASRVIPNFQFAWVLNPTGLIVSAVAILTVGVLSGLFPALKAEKLQVIEALRSE